MYDAINDILKEKRRIDKYNMELEDKVTERNVSDFEKRQKIKNEERKMRIKLEKSLQTLKKEGMYLVDRGGDEETMSKDVLDEKLGLEVNLTDLNETLNTQLEEQQSNRDELIKLRVKGSQLDTQVEMLTIEEKQLDEQNQKLTEDNEKLTNENQVIDGKIKELIQRIKVHNLLKDIDMEELQLLARNNKQMNTALENMVT